MSRLGKQKKMTYEKWLDTFRPEVNIINPGAPFDGLMFETHGAELCHVTKHPDERIWTLLDDDHIVSGFRFVNRVGYFVTKNSLRGTKGFIIKIDD